MMEKREQKRLASLDQERLDAERRATAIGLWDRQAIKESKVKFSERDIAELIALNVTEGQPKGAEGWRPYFEHFSKKPPEQVKKMYNKMKQSGKINDLDLLSSLSEEEIKELIPSWGS